MGDERQFVFTGQLTQEQLTAVLRHASRKAFWSVRLLSLVMVPPILALLGDDALSFGVPLCIVMVAFVTFFLPARARRRLVRQHGPALTKPYNYRIDAEGIRATSQLNDSFLRWPMCERVEQLPGALLLRIRGGQLVAVAVGQLSPDTQVALASFVQAHSSSAASAPPAGNVTAGSARETE